MAALWYHPSEDVSSVIVAFASDCPDWNFLNGSNEYPSARLRIAVRSALALVSSLRPITAKEAPYHAGERNTSREENRLSMNLQPAHPVEPMAKEDEKNTSLSKCLIAAHGAVDIESVFRDLFGITYDELSIVNTIKKERAARAFYLHFPLEVEDEFQLVLRFLKRYDMVAFSNRVEGDWEKFVKTATTGTILVSFF